MIQKSYLKRYKSMKRHVFYRLVLLKNTSSKGHVSTMNVCDFLKCHVQKSQFLKNFTYLSDLNLTLIFLLSEINFE